MSVFRPETVQNSEDIARPAYVSEKDQRNKEIGQKCNAYCDSTLPRKGIFLIAEYRVSALFGVSRNAFSSQKIIDCARCGMLPEQGSS